MAHLRLEPNPSSSMIFLLRIVKMFPLSADNRLRLIEKHVRTCNGSDHPFDGTYSEKAAAVLESSDARDFYLTAADINNIKSKYVDCFWKRAKRDVESVYFWVGVPL